MTPLVTPARTITALAAAATVFGGLWLIGRPLALADDLDQAAMRLRAAKAGPRTPAQWREGAVCPSLATAATFETQLASAALASGLKLESLKVAPPVAASAPGLKEIALQLKANGAYPGAVGFLDRLAQITPTLLVSAADLKRNPEGVELVLEGAYWCRG